MRRPPLRCQPAVTRLEDRLAPAYGDLDPTFGAGGRLELPYSGVGDVVAQPDGGVVVAVSGGLVRLLPSGAPDPAFGAGGLAAFPPATAFAPVLTAVGVQPDGGVVVGGRPAASGDAEFAAVRYRPDGTRDLAFGGPGGGGVAVAPSPGADRVDDLAVAPDGRIVLAGTTGAGGAGDTRSAAAVARLSPDGTPDPAFNGGRLRVVDVGLSVGVVVAAVRPADGAVALAAGASEVVGGQSVGRVVVARVLADGTGTDPAFGAASYTDPATGRTAAYTVVAAAAPPVFLQSSESVGVAGVAVQPTGDVVVGVTGSGFRGRGSSALPFADGRLVRVRGADGAVDTTFGADGAYATGPLAGLAVEPGGHVVAVGTVYDASTFTTLIPAGVRVTRVTPDGKSGAGWTIDFGGQEAGQAIALDRTGRPVVAGTVRRFADGTESLTTGVARLLWPGTPQPVLAGGPANAVARRLAPADGRYAAGDPRTVFDRTAVGVRTASADVTGDGVPDLIAGMGPGTMTVTRRLTVSPTDSHPRPEVDVQVGGWVRVVDGATGEVARTIVPFEEGFTGGVYVAAADLTGDGKAEVIVTADRGGGPVVVVYDLTTREPITEAPRQVARFYGIDDPNFRGGARPAAADLTGDGRADLVVAAGFLGGPRVAVYDGASVATGAASPVKLGPDFFAFEETLRNGAFVAAGDVTGDGKAEVAFGGGPGGGPRVRVIGATALLSALALGQPSLDGTPGLDPLELAQRRRVGDPTILPVPAVADFFAGDPAARGGVRPALRDADGDGLADLVTGSGAGEPGRVRVYRAATLRAAADPAPDQELDPFGGDPLADGVFVG